MSTATAYPIHRSNGKKFLFSGKKKKRGRSFARTGWNTGSASGAVGEKHAAANLTHLRIDFA
jgi:hypothetical protein